MNELTTAPPVSSQTLEHVLGTGDLSKLTTQERVAYYVGTCQSLGLNPLTRPFRFLSLNGQIQLYATKDCTDQLRSVRGITLHIVDKSIDSDLYIVTARAKDRNGREDEDIGAVSLPRTGESRANALMKGTTKAKRRVTLSICGLGGMPDESELDTMPGAQTFDPEDDLPVAPIKRAAQIEDKAKEYEAPPKTTVGGDRTDAQWTAWLIKLRDACGTIYRREELEQLAKRGSVGDAIQNAPLWVKRDIDEILAEAYGKFPAEEPATSGEDELPPIVGEDKVMAGD